MNALRRSSAWFLLRSSLAIVDCHDIDPPFTVLGAGSRGPLSELGSSPTSASVDLGRDGDERSACRRAKSDQVAAHPGSCSRTVVIAADDATERLVIGWNLLPDGCRMVGTAGNRAALRSLGSRRTKGDLGGLPDT